MKVAIVIPFLCFAVSAAVAQQQQPKALLEIVNESKVDKPKQPVDISSKLKQLAPKAKLLAVTSKGKIYALPLDNMPVLVPDKSATVSMPNVVNFNISGNTIPNALPVQPVVPSKLSLGPIVMPKRPLLKHKRSDCRINVACTTPAI